MKIELFASTNVGQVRDHNEDNFAVCKNLSEKDWTFKREEIIELSEMGSVMVVADGMGGTNAGEIASDLAQKSIERQFCELTELPKESEIINFLKNTIVVAHNDIVKHQQSNLETAGMGTTLVVGWLLNKKLYTAWCGDSRLYIYRKDIPLYPHTDDHSLVWELVKQGELTPEEARLHPESNIITQSLGDASRSPKPDASITEIYKGDRILTCSDGLTGMISDEEIHQILTDKKETPEAVKTLIEAANREGGTDNITVILLDVIEGEEPPADLKEKNAAMATLKIKSRSKEESEQTAQTPTAKLKGSVFSRNIIIAVLVMILAAVVTYFMVFKKENGGATAKLETQRFTIENSTPINFDLNLVLTGKPYDSITFTQPEYGTLFSNSSATFSYMPDTIPHAKEITSSTIKIYAKNKDVYEVVVEFTDLRKKAVNTPTSTTKPKDEPVKKQEESKPQGEEEQKPADPKPTENKPSEVKPIIPKPTPVDTTKKSGGEIKTEI